MEKRLQLFIVLVILTYSSAPSAQPFRRSINLTKIYDDSQVVAKVRVQSVKVVTHMDGVEHSEAHVCILDVYKSKTKNDCIDIKFAGSSANPVAGSPMLMSEKEYILFISTNDGEKYIINGMEGLFMINRNDLGNCYGNFLESISSGKAYFSQSKVSKNSINTMINYLKAKKGNNK